MGWRENFGGNWHAHYFDCDDDLWGAYVYPNASDFIHCICMAYLC